MNLLCVYKPMVAVAPFKTSLFVKMSMAQISLYIELAINDVSMAHLCESLIPPR